LKFKKKIINKFITRSDFINISYKNKFIFIHVPKSGDNYARMEKSMYHDNTTKNESNHMDYDLLKNANLNDCAQFLIEGKLKHHPYWGHQWKPQTFWLKDKQNEIGLDFLGCCEYLEEDFEILKKQFNINASLKHLNKSKNKVNLSNQLNAASKQILNDYYSEDFELYDQIIKRYK